MLTPCLQVADDSLANALQAEPFGLDRVERQPLTGGSIIGSMEHGGVFHLALKEEIERGDIHPTV